MAEQVVISFEDAFGKLGNESTAFMGRMLFADFVPPGSVATVKDEDQDPNSVVLFFYYGDWGMEPILFTSMSYDPTTKIYTFNPATMGLTNPFVIAGCWL